MTQPDVQATLQARFVDDDTLVRTGRALLEVDGYGWVVVPVPAGWAEMVQEVSAAAVEANNISSYVGSAEDAAERAETGASTATGHATQTADDRRQTGEDRTQTGLDRQAAAQSATNAATSAGEAATHEDTSLDAAAAAIAAAVSVAQFQGHGFPEGQVAAPVGSIYTDLDATAGAIRWIKTSGTGNTGWQVEYGDTGWRNVSADCDPAIVGNAKLYLRRCNERVYITFKGGSAVAGKLYLVPTNFQPDLQPWNRPATHVYRHGGATSSTMNLGGSLAWSDSIHLQGGGPFDSSSSAHLSFPVSRAWPTTLPGTPV